MVRRGTHKGIGLLAGAVCVLAAIAPQAQAAELLLSTDAGVAGTHRGVCTDRPLDEAGVITETVTAASTSRLTATLSGGSGDWDLAVFSARSREAVAGSASSGPDEIAGGYAFSGEELIVQACRLPSATGTPALEVEVEPIDTADPPPSPSLLRVQTPTPQAAEALAASGLDVTHSAGEGFVDVVSHGSADEAALTRLGLPFVTQVDDLTAPQPTTLRAARGKGFPSGRSGTYRRLFDYSEEMKALAAKYPDLVRVFTLPHQTWEGRTVEGIEISAGVAASSGKPTFLQLGLHHAREWPSGEYSLEWAYELLEGYAKGEQRASRLLTRTRTIIVPVVNPDGFNTSREAGELAGAGGGRGISSEGTAIVRNLDEYRRKNCRLADDSAAGSCRQPPIGNGMEAGVDINRNYGTYWGGPGAGVDPLEIDYRGPAPFSEPETQNIRSLFSTNSITAFVTNHPYSQALLYPPGVDRRKPIPDRKLFDRLGKRLSRQNGYYSMPGYEFYETTGTTEDWAYASAGSLGLTFEIGNAFHPPFAEMLAEWNGSKRIVPRGGGGNRGAYYAMAEFVTKRESHSVIRGAGPAGGTITASKSFETATSPVLDQRGAPGAVQRFPDSLSATVGVGVNGRYVLNLNPSTRPAVAPKRERWTLTCRGATGEVTGTHSLFIKRGKVKQLDLSSGC